MEKQKEDIVILAIESSCDETAAAVVRNGREICSNIISSQIELHKLYGGVVPEIASRKHIEKINQVIEEALEQAEVTLDDIDAVGVTYGPGLVGALLVGVAEAKAIAYARNLPLVGVHHIEGHVSANYIEHPDLEPPFMCLIVSGGHTHLVIVKDYGEFEILGRTRDDAAGEAFDKVARAIGLGYPGGPKIDKLAKEGNPDAIRFPKAKIEDGPYDFSFSGVKSAVLNHLNHCRMQNLEIIDADIAASFQKAVVDTLVEKAVKAAREYKMDRLAIAGGVASNGSLRLAMAEACEKAGIRFYYPSPVFCTDNAAMIGVAAYYEYIKGTRHGWDLNAVPNLKLGGTVMKEKCTAIVLAAGSGKRMGTRIQKQYLDICGYPVLYYALKCFQDSPLIDEIILVAGERDIEYCRSDIVGKYHFTKIKKIVAGGKERYDSVYVGLKNCQDCDYVFIHDGARPFVEGGNPAAGIADGTGLRRLCGCSSLKRYR